jgi:hypothetical protein
MKHLKSVSKAPVMASCCCCGGFFKTPEQKDEKKGMKEPKGEPA